MSDWIDAEMEKFRAEKEIELQGNNLVNYSNYWARLLLQLGRDVDSINYLPDFEKVLKKGVLKFMPCADYYVVQMAAKPNVNISIKNGGQTITVRTIIDRLDGTEIDNEVEFKVVAKDERIYLELNGKFFVVPEQASQEILKPILEELKNGAF